MLSCSKEKEAYTGEYVTSFKATTSQVRASVNTETGSVGWESGDVIAVSDGETTASFTYDETTQTFVGEQPLKKTGNYVAYYPASQVKSIAADGTISITLPETQEYASGKVTQIPMSATSTTTLLPFQNLCTILKFTPNAEQKLSSAVFTANTKTVCGNASVNGGTLVPESAGLKSVSLTIASPLQLGEGEAVYLLLPAQVYTGGFTLKLNYSDGTSFEKSSTKDIALGAGVIEAMKAFDASLFSGGLGTAENPYKISKAGDIVDLINFTAGSDAALFVSGHYLQTCDIDMSGEGTLTPVCVSTSNPFSGTYDGGNFAIRNMTISSPATCGGIFAYVTGGTIRNVCAKGVSVTTSTNANGTGVLVGQAAQDALIENCIVDETCSVKGKQRVGGVVGSINDGVINKCVSRAAVTATTSVAGGVVGQALSKAGATDEIIIINCICEGNTIQGTLASGNVYLGGIAGGVNTAAENSSHAYVANCYAYPKLIKNTGATGAVMSGVVGGVVTTAGVNNAIITNCYSPTNFTNFSVNGSVVDWRTFANYSYISGIAYFRESGTMDRCYSRYCFRIVSTYPEKKPTYTNISHQVGEASFKNFDDIVYNTNYKQASTPDSYPTMKEALDAGVAVWNASHTVQAVNWAVDETNDGYLKPEGLFTPSATTKKRISIMGDSISTFGGFGFSDQGFQYARYYPYGTSADASAGQVLKESDTWWYKLIYNKMSNARLEVNSCFSGSTVTYINTAEQNLPRSTTCCFVNRFEKAIGRGGIGNPDIVIIYGGRNDWGAVGGNSDKYVGKSSTMATDYAKNIEDIDFTNYYGAYVRLLRGIHAQHPNTKILMLMCDMISDSYHNAGQNICNFFKEKGYDIKYVSFHKPGQSPTDATGGVVSIAKQAGPHPNPSGMTTCANYIYTQVGSWLEE